MAHILLIEDDNQARKAIRKMLEKIDNKVTEAQNGKLGIQLYKNNSFDLVITDIVMPEKEGIEVIFELRQINPAAKIIAISGGGSLGTLEYLDMAKKLGAKDSISKPIRFEELISTVETVLKGD